MKRLIAILMLSALLTGCTTNIDLSAVQSAIEDCTEHGGVAHIERTPSFWYTAVTRVRCEDHTRYSYNSKGERVSNR